MTAANKLILCDWLYTIRNDQVSNTQIMAKCNFNMDIMNQLRLTQSEMSLNFAEAHFKITEQQWHDLYNALNHLYGVQLP